SRREVFDNMLFQNAKKYATVLEDTAVTDVLVENGTAVGVKTLQAGQPQEFRAKVIVGADGAQSVVARKMGIADNPKKHHCTALRVYYKNIKNLTPNIELHFVDSILPGYFWIFPLEDNVANVGVGMVTQEMQDQKINLQAAMMDLIKNNPTFKERFEGAEALGPVKGWTLPFGSYHRPCFGNGFILVGDAASLIDPFTGEGIGNAMTSGLVAAQVIDEALSADDVSGKKLQEYDGRLWHEIGDELKTSYNLQKFGKYKFLLNLVVGKASSSQKVREQISGMLSNEKSKKQFTGILFYLKLLFS
ncbi:MAG TPA: NAD(P)/FAD-dependent oxidoreductase, partial [Candidatus Norongarragalinales archaeon]|nr:NAD(P)/FAD-dependent oxidoreductase [Candidatus Norongarragalinales archaeon]